MVTIVATRKIARVTQRKKCVTDSISAIAVFGPNISPVNAITSGFINISGSGSAGTAIDNVGTAAIALGGQRAVYLSGTGLRYATSADISTLDVVGITVGAVNSGDLVTYRVSGVLTDPSFNFVPGPIFLGANGLLTQTIPLTGGTAVLGVALSATSMSVRILQPIELA